MSDVVRVLRVIEYVGSREYVEKQVSGSLHGERKGIGDVIIKAATIGNYPEVLDIELPKPQPLTKNKPGYF